MVSTMRSRTPAGWLVLYREFRGSAGLALQDMVFVPDPEGIWDVEKERLYWKEIYHNPIAVNFRQDTHRIRTPGGWIILDRYFMRREPFHAHVCMTYVPDEEHKWNPKE
jgi:hypothetical protein